MSIHTAMTEACAVVQIIPPRATRPGHWVQCPAVGKGASNGSGRVLVFDDARGGIAWNWITSQQQRFSVNGLAGRDEVKAPPRDPEADRLAEIERRDVAEACSRILRACEPAQHPYLTRKGFPSDMGLVIADPRPHMPKGQLGEAMASALPDGEGPLLVIPGRPMGKSDQRPGTLQFITAEGAKKNILRGVMSGSAHRIAVGRETWVCEGIATAMSVKAALALLNRPATVLCAFSAANVAKVATCLSGAILAADNDKPIETLGGLGTGEYYAVRSGRKWTMPAALGDFNDMHQREGLRAVAMHLREVGVG